MEPKNFRTNTLTIAGLIGYLVFLAAAILKIRGYPVSWELLGILLVSSSGLLGVDPGIDVFGPFLRSQSNGENTQPSNDKEN